MGQDFWLAVTAFATAFAALAAIVAVIIARINLKRLASNSLFIKTIDVTISFSERYEKINALRFSENQNDASTKDFFKRFWNLQSEQFDLFLKGVIDPVTYATWLQQKISLFSNSDLIGGTSAWQGWVLYGRRSYSENRLFVYLMDAIFAYSHTRATGLLTEEPDFIMRKVRELYENERAQKFRSIMLRVDHDWAWEKFESLYSKPHRQSTSFLKFEDPQQFSSAIDHEKREILIPAITNEIRSIVEQYRPVKPVNILDFGCGDFVIGRMIQSEEQTVLGFDPDREMLFVGHSADDLEPSKLFHSLDDFKDEVFDICLMVYVHQVIDNRSDLIRLFSETRKKLVPGGLLLIIGAHPEHIGKEFSAFSYSVDAMKISEGQKYGGTIYGPTKEQDYNLVNTDTFWRLSTIKHSLNAAGFDLRDTEADYIADKASDRRIAGIDGHPYFKLSARKANRNS